MNELETVEKELLKCIPIMEQESIRLRTQDLKLKLKVYILVILYLNNFCNLNNFSLN